ncbi:MAG: lamin tail domain-containing protein [Candidatus Saccharimonadota bacterium]
MLKKIWKLFLGLVVCASSACVTPTHASSASPVVLTVIQASGVGGALDELVHVYNNSSVPQDITGWCLKNKASVHFACLQPKTPGYQLMLPVDGTVAIASTEHVMTSGNDGPNYGAVYALTNQSSGSIVGGADTISLVNASGATVDSFSWAVSAPAQKGWSRMMYAGSDGQDYATTGLPSDWSTAGFITIPINHLYEQSPPAQEPDDVSEDPENETGDGENNPNEPDVDLPTEPLELHITELLPNPEGTDTGLEFIELFNPHTEARSFEDYELRIGPALEKTYSLAELGSIQPGEYVAAYSAQLGFTLVNSTSSVQLWRAGIAASSVISYSQPASGHAWTLIGSAWRYVSLPSPGSENSQADPDISGDSNLASQSSSTTVKPCAANQYRSSETNRCRLIQQSSSQPTPCKAGQERNPETNRCRAVSSATTPAPCKPNQERNPETNRCRNIVAMSDAGHAIKGASVQSAQTGVSVYTWLAIGSVVLLILSYAAWEWRVEGAALVKKVRKKFHR